MLHVGLDVHERSSAVCILDENGKKVKEHSVRGHPRRVITWLRRHIDTPFQICFEASTSYGYLYDELRRIAHRVVVAHPGRLRLIFRSRRKNDRVDAAKLAKLLYLDALPAVYVPSAEIRSWRGMIEHRHRCVRSRTRCKLTIRALLRTHGVETLGRRRLWSKRGRAWLESVELPDEISWLRLEGLLADLDHFDARIGRLESILERIAEKHPAVALLRTIAGVGIRTAEAFVAYVDNPDRFRRSKSIGCYLGLIPRQDASSDTNRLGHITKEGPGTVRQMLAEASWQAIRRSPTVRAFFERIAQGRKDRRKIALVATAHYLAGLAGGSDDHGLTEPVLTDGAPRRTSLMPTVAEALCLLRTPSE